MEWFPEVPDAPDDQKIQSTLELRFEDVDRTGRFLLPNLPTAVSTIGWVRAFSRHAGLRALRARGVLPVMSRIVLAGGDAPLAVRVPLDVEASFELAHSVGHDGEVERLFMLAYAVLRGASPEAAKHSERPPKTTVAGRLHCVHVFTKPFAPKGQNRVTRFGTPGLPDVPSLRHDFVHGERLLALPDDAVALDAELSRDPLELVFGRGHTDLNQHVNTAVYLRMFEDAALRRARALGQNVDRRLRFADAIFRKPTFAGETRQLELRLFTLGDVLGAVGAFREGKEDSRGTAHVRMTFADVT